MAAQPPLTHVVLKASSVADDLGYVALADITDVLGSSTYRIIGGHMVTALVARWHLGPDLYRETRDSDLGVPPVVIREEGVVERLISRGYERIKGNRFARPVNGERLAINVALPDEVAALTLKGLASKVRDKPTDIVDLWRCLEISHAAGLDASAFADGDAAEAARIIRSAFDRRDGAAMSTLVREQRLSVTAGDERFTRIRALTQRILT